jgi:hypothetical protein
MRKAAVLASAVAFLVLAAVGSGSTHEIHPAPGHYVGETLTDTRRVSFSYSDGSVFDFRDGGGLPAAGRTVVHHGHFLLSIFRGHTTEEVKGNWISPHQLTGTIHREGNPPKTWVFHAGSFTQLHP